MSEINLDTLEQDLLAAYESGEFTSELTQDRKKLIKQTAENTLRQDKQINIRISACDWDAIQRRALEEGLPSQALVASILHKYVSGGLYDATANKSHKDFG